MTTALAVVPDALPDPREVPLGAVRTSIIPRAIAKREAAREAKSVRAADGLRRELAAFEKYFKDKQTHTLLAAESRRTEIVMGTLLPSEQGTRTDLNFSIMIEKSMVPLSDASVFRLLAKYETRVEQWLSEGLVSRTALLGKIRRLDEQPTGPLRAEVELASWEDWLPQQPECDLLLTDPPYMTDLKEPVEVFAARWLPLALTKVKPTGRAYVCVGAYPRELAAYFAVLPGRMALENVVVWHYRNTLGPKPTHDYKQSWQAVLYYRGPQAPPLDCPKMTEQFDVQDIPAPDGRRGERDHPWQKPDELARRFVCHATAPGDLVLDPFAGTGTFPLIAAAEGRQAFGCESNPEMLEIARERGCHVAGT